MVVVVVVSPVVVVLHLSLSPVVVVVVLHLSLSPVVVVVVVGVPALHSQERSDWDTLQVAT